MPVPYGKRWEEAINQESREMLDNLMSEHGWEREIETVTIDYHPRTGPILNNWNCKGSRLSCRCEGRSSFIYLTRYPTGVIMTCAFCRRNTSGPVAMNYFDKVSSRRITLKKAFETCKRENILPPSGLSLAYPDKRRLQGRPRIVV